jgi:membrane protease YdiL (CAAX protease family)
VSRSRFLLEGLLKLCVAAGCLVGAIAAYRLLVHPMIESVFSLSKDVSSIVRRVDIFAIVVLSYWGFVHYYERRAARELAPRWGWMLLAGGAGAVSIGVTILALYATGQYQVVSTRGIGPAWGVFGVLWIAAVLEEVAFRGILFRLLEERIGTNAALVGSAIVFGVAHMANNGAGWVTMLMVTLAGLMWAGVFVLSRNIWVTAAHHFCWNATIFVIGLPLSGDADVRARAPVETIYHGSALWTGGVFGPEDSLLNILVMIGICLALWRVVRRRGLILPPGTPGQNLTAVETA